MGLKIFFHFGANVAHLFGHNAAALVKFLGCKASVGRVYKQPWLKSCRYLSASCPVFTVYCHWVRGTTNPADPISKLHDQFGGNLALAREAPTRKVGDLSAFADRKTVFFMDPGRP